MGLVVAPTVTRGIAVEMTDWRDDRARDRSATIRLADQPEALQFMTHEPPREGFGRVAPSRRRPRRRRGIMRRSLCDR